MSSSSRSQLREEVAEAYRCLAEHGYARFFSPLYREALGEAARAQLSDVLDSFSRLPLDTHMGDGGTYRFRAYSRFSLTRREEAIEVAVMEGNSIFQTTEDNPVNGGVVRTFAPLELEIASGPLLKALIAIDFSHAFHCDPRLSVEETVVGVHQVRIVTRPGQLGHPAPEGIHRDRERFTFQHFMARHNIEGGEFRAYDERKELLLGWLQQDGLDTVMFEGSTWHGATPIAALQPEEDGYRDIFLIDFDFKSPTA